jgi:hypothetical protein
MILKWAIVAILLLILLWYIKAGKHAKKIKIIIVILILLFGYYSIVTFFAPERAELKAVRGIINTANVYFEWVVQASANLWDIGTDTVHMVGNAIKTNETKSG